MTTRLAIVLSVTACCLLPAHAGDDHPDDRAGDRAALLEAHNRERAEAKLPPLQANAQLEAAARRHARDMAQHEKLTHDGSDGSTPADRVKQSGYRYHHTGENVAVEYKDVAAVMRGWMESPPHRKNVLGDFTEMGGAVARDRDGRPYWCVEFGTPLPPRPDFTAESAGAALITVLNAERKSAERVLLTRNPVLTEAAQRHANTLARLDKIVAKDDDGLTALDRVAKAGYRYRRLAEEAASGLDTPEEVVRAWLERPTDRENALGGFTEAGVGYAVAHSERAYWCVIFGSPAR